jgi:serine/threonine protein kinase
MDFAAARRKWERLESKSQAVDALEPATATTAAAVAVAVAAGGNSPTVPAPRITNPLHAPRGATRGAKNKPRDDEQPQQVAAVVPARPSERKIQAGWQDVVGNTAPSSRRKYRHDDDVEEDEVNVVRGDQIDDNLEAIEEGYPPEHEGGGGGGGGQHGLMPVGSTSNTADMSFASARDAVDDRGSHSEGSEEESEEDEEREDEEGLNGARAVGSTGHDRLIHSGSGSQREQEHVGKHANGDAEGEENGVDDGEEFSAESAEDDTPVRQNSNFSRLSAQSWLTVDSVDDDGGAATGRSSRSAEAGNDLNPRNNHGPAPPVAVSVDPHATVMDARHTVDLEGNSVDVVEYLRTKSSAQKTVLECCIELLAGSTAYKKKAFRRFGARRVWLSADCKRLCWTSKKGSGESPFMQLASVSRLRCQDREVSIEVLQGRRVALLFGNAAEACMWTRCLSCLIPLQALVRAPPNVVPSEKDREDYNLVDDTFSNRSLRTFASVNAYVILGFVAGHNAMARLVLSRADKAFFNIRYVPQRLAPYLLRSNEEIAVLKRLAHPNIVKYHECLADSSRGGSYVLFEHTPRGVATDTLLLEGVQPMAERAARLMICDLISGLQYLHSLRIVHADVRPDNLLRAVDGSLKLNPIGCITQDFTEIHDMTALVKARLGAASPAFLAPELCWNGPVPKIPPKSYAMDVWAVGAVLYFLLYGRVPFYGDTLELMQMQICTAKLKFPRKPETSRKVRNFLKGVLGEKDPRNRIGLADLMLHPWFSDGGLNDLTNGRAPSHVRLVVSAEEVGSAIAPAKVRKADVP